MPPFGLHGLRAPESLILRLIFPSRMRKNHQATMKTRYCGHLYSSLLRKRTWWDHRDQVSYYMEGRLRGTEGSPPGRVGGLVGDPSRLFALVVGLL